jgi:hypothetical protein
MENRVPPVTRSVSRDDGKSSIWQHSGCVASVARSDVCGVFDIWFNYAVRVIRNNF